MKNFEKYKTANDRYDAFHRLCSSHPHCENCFIKGLATPGKIKTTGYCSLIWLDLDERKEDWEVARDDASLLKKRLFGLPVNFCFVLNESAFDGLVANACLQDGNGDPITDETPSSDIFIHGIPCRIGSGSDRPVHAEVWLESEAK